MGDLGRDDRRWPPVASAPLTIEITIYGWSTRPTFQSCTYLSGVVRRLGSSINSSRIGRCIHPDLPRPRCRAPCGRHHSRGSGPPGKTGSWVPRRVRERAALCACGVITQGAQLPGTSVRDGSPGEKGQVESLTDRLLIGWSGCPAQIRRARVLGCPWVSASLRGGRQRLCPPHTHDGAGCAFYELDLSRPGSSRC